MEDKSDILVLREGNGFVETPYIRALTERAVSYINAGFPVNLSGPAGVGKTTLALHIASRFGRPAVLVCGDFEHETSDLIGGLNGFHRKFMRDNFIRSVLKTDETMTQEWSDDRLTNACKYGFTLIYDEFTRSRPEANNVLLSVLEEKVLVLPGDRSGGSYLKVHPDFRAIFTSNPEEYAGVQRSQDALRDRMVTLEVGNFDEETEIAITHKKSKLSAEDCCRVVDLVRKVREVKSHKLTPTVRACIMISKIMNLTGGIPTSGKETFRQTCFDVLLPECPDDERNKVRQLIDNIVISCS
jgi:nitric oxide reductase NorQ protein